MGFWIFMSAMELLIPVVMIVCGWLFVNHPPKKRNRFYGYRTSRSMKSQDAWNFAHAHAGRFWFRAGWVVLVLTVPLLFLTWGKDVDTVSNWGGLVCGVQCVPLISVLFVTERALRNQFGS